MTIFIGSESSNEYTKSLMSKTESKNNINDFIVVVKLPEHMVHTCISKKTTRLTAMTKMTKEVTRVT